MSGKDFCDKVTIVGGIYNEICNWPIWNELFGSGWRAVRVFRSFCPKASIIFHTVGDDQIERFLKIYMKSEPLSYNLSKIPLTISFHYNHPLACPNVEKTFNEMLSLNITGCNVICFGMLEADTRIEGDWVVYDPQSPIHPQSFRKNGSKALHLAIVLNESEAYKLSGEIELEKVKTTLFKQEECDCLIIKFGARGAMVYTSRDDEGIVVPVYKTSHVFPIGSGDVFTTVFSYFWFCGYQPVDSAINASKATAIYCEGNDKIDLLPEILKKANFEQLIFRKKGLVYLAGPFFTLNAKLFVSECRSVLLAMGVRVFSPYHDVGEGRASDVVPKDIEMLKECSCVFAIADGLDSGTMFEIGYAVALGKKVVVYVENESEGAMKMLAGTRCDIENDFTTAIYKACWYASE